MEKRLKILAIDPGTMKSGVAIMAFEDDKIEILGFDYFTASGSKKERFKRSYKMFTRVLNFYKEFGPFDRVIMEYPRMHSGGRQGKAKDSGSIGILFHFCGMIHGAIEHVILCEPQEWKGNLPKRIVAARMTKEYGIQAQEDVMDAIGIGHWYLTKKV